MNALTLASHKGAVHTAIYNSTNTYVLTGGADRTIKLWNAQSGLQVKTYQGHGYEILGLACSKDNKRLASCGGDRSVFVWDVLTAQTTVRLAGHTGKVNAVAFNDNDSILVSAGFDTSVKLWDMKANSRVPIQTLDEARDSVTCVLVRGSLIVTASVDGHTRVYDVRQGEMRKDYFENPVVSVDVSQDGSLSLVATLDSKLRLMDLENGTLLKQFTGHKNESYRCHACFGEKEATVVMGDEQGKVWVWDTESGNVLTSTKKHDKAVLWTAHHPTLKQTISAGADGLVQLFEA